jgi:hypothetical protein
MPTQLQFAMFQISHYQRLVRDAKTLEHRIWAKAELKKVTTFYNSLMN